MHQQYIFTVNTEYLTKLRLTRAARTGATLSTLSSFNLFIYT
jgi:hypothetical protein